MKNPVPNVLARPNPKNIFEWNFVIYGLKDTLYTGYYHGQIILPPDYPFKAPKIQFITPNGRFEVNKSICLSFTNYHQESWSSAWDIEKMLLGLVSFMLTDQSTTGQIVCSSNQKKQYAKESIEFNLKNPKFMSIFEKELKTLGLDNINTQKLEKQQSQQINDFTILDNLVKKRSSSKMNEENQKQNQSNNNQNQQYKGQENRQIYFMGIIVCLMASYFIFKSL